MTLLELRLHNARLRLAEVSRLTEELITRTEGDQPGQVSLQALDDACEDLQWAVGQAMRTQHDLDERRLTSPAPPL